LLLGRRHGFRCRRRSRSAGTASAAQGKGVAGGCNCPGEPQVGGPVEVATGNLVEQVTDYETAGLDKLSVTRYYNRIATGGPPVFAAALGVNWSATHDRYICISYASSISAETADGQMLSVALRAGTWTACSDGRIHFLGSLIQVPLVPDEHDPTRGRAMGHLDNGLLFVRLLLS
jgi:hypothetical protein